jgi:hypothetical protein
MSVMDQRQFVDAVHRASSIFLPEVEDWAPAIHALNRLAMFDMLPALNATTLLERWMLTQHASQFIGPVAARRITWALKVIVGREIEDGLPPDQSNDGREYLGCTRLDDTGVRQIISDSLTQARAAVRGNPAYSSQACCGEFAYARVKVLVPRRRVPGASLISNLAAAAHYMLARHHVCSAKVSVRHMKFVVEGYDAKKRLAIAHGDPELKSIGLTGNRPFPPDFAIRAWAHRGAGEGENDRLRCNASQRPPNIAPTINQSEWGE